MTVNLYQDWVNAKEAERAAVEARRAIEDQIAAKIGPSEEGSVTFKDDGYTIRYTVKYNRTVDGDKLQEIATANGLEAYLSTLFRWKPELNLKAWKGTSENITKALAEAITTKPGRPGFDISKEE
jgi:hypothetical protein